MFKKISCVTCGIVITSLISAVEPAQALSFRSSSSSYTSSLNSGSFNSFGAPTTSYNKSYFSPGTTNLLAQGAELDGGGNNWWGLILLPLLAWMLIEGLEDENNSDSRSSVVLGTSTINPPVITPGGGTGGGDTGGGTGGDGVIGDGTNKPPTPVPSPALLPGLLGMGMAAIRKRNRFETPDQA